MINLKVSQSLLVPLGGLASLGGGRCSDSMVDVTGVGSLLLPSRRLLMGLARVGNLSLDDSCAGHSSPILTNELAVDAGGDETFWLFALLVDCAVLCRVAGIA